LVALLLSLTALALPSRAGASDSGVEASAEIGAAQQMAQQITGAALPQAPTAASITHVVTAAMARETAPAPVQAVAAAAASPSPPVPPPGSSVRPARVVQTQAQTRPATPHAAARPHPALGTVSGAPIHRHRPSANAPRRRSSPVAPPKPALSPTGWLPAHTSAPVAPAPDATPGEGFILELVGLARDSGFLQTIARAGSQTLTDPGGGLLVADAVGQIPGTAHAAPNLLPAPFRDLALRYTPRRGAARRVAGPRRASWHPAPFSGGVRQPTSDAVPPEVVRPIPAASRSQKRPRSERPDRPAAARHPTMPPVEAGPRVLTLFAGGPALGAPGGVASGAAAVALAGMLVLQLLQMLSGRLSLELVPWRSALLTLRLERPG
jgi:hypothetical protein